MGFLDGLVGGLSRGVTGGDNMMNLEDYLQLASMAVNAGTGNIPGVVGGAASMAGDATGNEQLSKLGDLAGLASGVGAIGSALGSGAGAAAELGSAAAEGSGALTGATGALSGVPEALSAGADATKVMSPLAENAQLLSAGAGYAPEAITGAGAAGNVFGQGADIAGQMDDLNSFVGPPPQWAAGEDPSKFKMALSSIMGDNAQDRMANGRDMAQDLMALAGQEGPMPQPQELDWQQTENIDNFMPSYQMALQDYLSQPNGGIAQNPYTAQYGG